jgi:toxin FitB
MFLLDTCVISELTRRSPNQNVADWPNGQADESLFLSILTIGELRKGIALQTDEKRKEALIHSVSAILRRYGGRVLIIDGPVIDHWAHMQANAKRTGVVLSAVDSLIAATALSHDLVVVTRNLHDFAATGAQLLNPWDIPAAPSTTL